MKKKTAARWMAVILAVAMIVGILAVSVSSFAATLTVSTDQVNVRESASTSANVVGTANSGDTFEVGDPVDGDDGHQWYQITLSNGATGYVRDDLVNVEASEEEAAEEQPAEEEAPAVDETAAAEDTSADAPTATTSSEKYQIVDVPDEAGNDVWYVYDYEEGLRIKIDDLSQFETIRESAQTNKTKADRYRVLVILFAVLLVILLVAVTLLILRLRDVTSGDVDLAETRRKERLHNRKADDVSGLQSATAAGRASRNRNRAYASGDGNGAARRSAPQTRTGAPAQRSADGQVRTQRPVQGTAQNAQRPVRPQQGTQARTQSAPQTRTQNGTTVRPQQNPYAQQGTRPATGNGQQVRTQRPVQNAAPSAENRVSRPQQSTDASQARRPVTQPKNFADDDDLDYDFLNTDK